MQRDKIQQIVSIAELYYLQDMKQSDIANKLGLARSTISTLLTQAKEMGIVRIDVCDPFRLDSRYSIQFKEKYGVNKCYTVHTSLKESEDITDLIASRAGELFSEYLRDNLTVGIAWGMGCYKFISHLKNNKKFSNIEVVPLIGGIDLSCYMHPQNEMIRQFADKLGGRANYIYAPFWAESKEEKQMYMQSAAMQRLSEKWKQIDIAILGIGSDPYHNKIFASGEVEYKKDIGLCGDLCGMFFDDDGNFPLNEYNERIISIDPELLRGIPEVLAIAGGDFKQRSIIGAMKTRIITTFITDSNTAKALL